MCVQSAKSYTKIPKVDVEKQPSKKKKLPNKEESFN